MSNNISTQIVTGGYEVISSGSFLSFSNAEISLNSGEFVAKILIEFINDTEAETKFAVEVISAESLKLKLINFENANLGLGTKTQIGIGKFLGRDLFFAFRIYTLDDKTLRTFDYTFYAK